MRSEVYLDNNATTRVLPEVQAAMLDCLDADYGNPSSAHTLGRRASVRIEAARDHVASLLGCSTPENIIFTSGGTEANNTVLTGVARGSKRRRKLVVSSVEHSSIIQTCHHLRAEEEAVIEWVPVNSSGQIDLERLESSIDEQTAAVSVQWVNNETGVIQDVQNIGQICREKDVPFHCDAAQALGKLPIEIDNFPIDFLTLSAHKIHGPKGVGAIYARGLKSVEPLIFGGDQENRLRAGTENVPGIVGFGEAARLRQLRLFPVLEHMSTLRDQFESGLTNLGRLFRINGHSSKRIVNTSNVTFIEVEGFALIAQLESEGIFCSQSSACTNHRPEPSYVLTEMGLSEDEGFSSIRFCFSELNTQEEIDIAIQAIQRSLSRLAA